jgi:periplasmic protein TonB
MLELKLKTATGTLPSSVAVDREQPRRKVLALVLLLATFGALIAKDHDFWFGTDDISDSDVVNSNVAQSAPARSVLPAARPVAAPVSSAKKQAKAAVTATVPAAQPTDSGLVATDRTVVPPLDVEVVAGDKHSKIRPGSNSTNLQISSTQPAGPATNAAERESMSTTIPASGKSVGDSYPMLAQQMKVQGSVVLQAIIGADGNIQDLRVIAGPSILTSAAQQAVRQWRFKPYLQNGQPVETKARITVNFTIHVADSSPKIS